MWSTQLNRHPKHTALSLTASCRKREVQLSICNARCPSNSTAVQRDSASGKHYQHQHLAAIIEAAWPSLLQIIVQMVS